MNDRGRLARNPISLLLFLSLAEVAAAQLIWGPKGSAVVLSMPETSQAVFAWSLLVSAGFVLLGAAMPEPRAYWLEAGGKAGCAIVLAVYTVTLPAASSSWTTGLGIVFGAVAMACVLRLARLTVLILFNFYPRLFATLNGLRRFVRFRR